MTTFMATSAAHLLPTSPQPSDPVPVQTPAHEKALATLRARAALMGWGLHTMTETDGTRYYLLSRWGMTRELPDLASVSRLLRQMGAPE
jgi:hypothetical protein